MPSDTTETAELKCVGCGFESPVGSDRWASVDHPSLGTMTQCPECGSTDVHNRS